MKKLLLSIALAVVFVAAARADELSDLKAQFDAAMKQIQTGMDNGPTLDFARRLGALNRPMWVRFVLVPGLTDDPQNVESIARFAAELGNVERVDVLPFHQMGRYKWEKLRLSYTLNDVAPRRSMPLTGLAPCSGRPACRRTNALRKRRDGHTVSL